MNSETRSTERSIIKIIFIFYLAQGMNYIFDMLKCLRLIDVQCCGERDVRNAIHTLCCTLFL